MIRKIIKIADEKCDGCGLCAKACHEGAIAMIDGKAKFVHDDYCDGLGDCLPVCPTGAICFEEREAAAYNKTAENINRQDALNNDTERKPSCCIEIYEASGAGCAESLRQWPVQIKLVPINAAYFDNADLLIAADCAAFACSGFHQLYMKNKIVVIGCPKLDNVDYSVKLTEIIKANNINSVTVIRMIVPCCYGIEHAALSAIKASEKLVPFHVHVLSTEGAQV